MEFKIGQEEIKIDDNLFLYIKSDGNMVNISFNNQENELQIPDDIKIFEIIWNTNYYDFYSIEQKSSNGSDFSLNISRDYEITYKNNKILKFDSNCSWIIDHIYY